MDTKILASFMVIGLVASAIGMGTFAYFSDTETSKDNTFTAGTIDLQVDYDCYYNKHADGTTNCPSWTLRDLTTEKFFDFDDVKPGDFGEGTISLHGFTNDACVWVTITPTKNDDMSSTEPELEAGDSPEDPDDLWDGELAQNLYFFIWEDNGEDGEPGTGDYGEGDNIWQSDERILTEGYAYDIIDGVRWYIDLLPHSKTYYIGVKWNIDSGVGNIIQSDSFVGDISFYVEQERNNPNCPPTV